MYTSSEKYQVGPLTISNTLFEVSDTAEFFEFQTSPISSPSQMFNWQIFSFQSVGYFLGMLIFLSCEDFFFGLVESHLSVFALVYFIFRGPLLKICLFQFFSVPSFSLLVPVPVILLNS